MRNYKHVTLRVKDLQIYLGRSRNTAGKYYRAYLSAIGKKDHQALTLLDLSRLEDKKPDILFAEIFS